MVVTTQLLTGTHGSLIRLHQVSTSPRKDRPCSQCPKFTLCIYLPPLSTLLTCQANERATAITVLCSCSEAAHAGQPATMLGEHAYDSYLSALKEVCMSV